MGSQYFPGLQNSATITDACWPERRPQGTLVLRGHWFSSTVAGEELWGWEGHVTETTPCGSHRWHVTERWPGREAPPAALPQALSLRTRRLGGLAQAPAPVTQAPLTI